MPRPHSSAVRISARVLTLRDPSPDIEPTGTPLDQRRRRRRRRRNPSTSLRTAPATAATTITTHRGPVMSKTSHSKSTSSPFWTTKKISGDHHQHRRHQSRRDGQLLAVWLGLLRAWALRSLRVLPASRVCPPVWARWASRNPAAMVDHSHGKPNAGRGHGLHRPHRPGPGRAPGGRRAPGRAAREAAGLPRVGPVDGGGVGSDRTGVRRRGAGGTRRCGPPGRRADRGPALVAGPEGAHCREQGPGNGRAGPGAGPALGTAGRAGVGFGHRLLRQPGRRTPGRILEPGQRLPGRRVPRLGDSRRSGPGRGGSGWRIPAPG